MLYIQSRRIISSVTILQTHIAVYVHSKPAVKQINDLIAAFQGWNNVIEQIVHVHKISKFPVPPTCVISGTITMFGRYSRLTVLG